MRTLNNGTIQYDQPEVETRWALVPFNHRSFTTMSDALAYVTDPADDLIGDYNIGGYCLDLIEQ